MACLFWTRCCAGSWGWAVNETQSLLEQRLYPLGRVTCVMRQLQQLRSKLPWEHTCIHTEGASLPGVVGSIYTQLVLARSPNSSQALYLLTLGCRCLFALLFLFSHGKSIVYPGKHRSHIGAALVSLCYLVTSVGSLKKQESYRKISALLTTPKRLTVWITTNSGKFLNRWDYQTNWPASWETCMQVRKQQLEPDMEQQTGSK